MDESEGVSYIIIHDLSPEAKIIYLSPSLTEVLGYEPREIIGSSSFTWIHPEEVEGARRLHYDTIREDKAAAVAYLRVLNQERRYVPCVIRRSMVYNALVGSISFARPGARALHTAATAQEVIFLTPTAPQQQLEFRRWNDPTPRRPPNATNHGGRLDPALFDQLPTPSQRTAFILDRFSQKCPVEKCTNDLLIPAARVFKRSFFDFVVPEDEANVRGWIEVSKGWGVSESGLPSDSGFVFGGFRMCLQGRDSSESTISRSRGRRHRGSISDSGPNDIVAVEAIFTAHSDGFIVVVRRDESNS